SAYFYYLKKNGNHFSLYDEVKYASDNLKRLHNIVISRNRTDLAIVLHEKMTEQIRKAFTTKFFKVKFITIESYEKSLHQGGILKGLIKSNPNIGFLDV